MSPAYDAAGDSEESLVDESGLFEADEFVCKYKDERVAWEVAMTRPPRDPARPDQTFFFGTGAGYVIDGAVGGNSARWFNHSCAPTA